MNNEYALFHCHSFFSILDGFSDPNNNCRRAKELGLHTIAITDHGSIGGVVEHLDAAKKHNINKALGIELYISYQSGFIKSPENRGLEHLVIWAKNKIGWQSLLKIVDKTMDYYYYRPRISLLNETIDGVIHPGLETFVGVDKGIIGFSGHMGSSLSNILFYSPNDDYKVRKEKIKKAYSTKDHKNFSNLLDPNWIENTSSLAIKLQNVFGVNNFYIELQNCFRKEDINPIYISPFIVEKLREVSKNTGIKCSASGDPHYSEQKEADLQRVLLSVNMKQTEEQIQQKLDSDDTDVLSFFSSDNFYIHSRDSRVCARARTFYCSKVF